MTPKNNAQSGKNREAEADKISFLIAYRDEQYEISDFLDEHPAGRAILLPFRNKSITNAFESVGHSALAKKILAKHKFKKENETMIPDHLKDPRKKVDFKFWIRKLFTPEDPMFLHKFFGLLSLSSFAYRYCYALPMNGNLGIDGTAFDLLTLFVHFMLSSSSLIFHVISKRNTTRPCYCVYVTLHSSVLNRNIRRFFESACKKNFARSLYYYCASHC